MNPQNQAPRSRWTRVFSLLCLSASWLAAAGAGRAETRYVEGEVIVTFKSGVSATRASERLERRSVAFARRFESLSARRQKQTGLVRDDARTTADLIADLRGDPEVETAEPNYLRWRVTTPNDPRFAELWALRNTGQSVGGTQGAADADVKFLGARALARATAAELVVGVIDTGLDVVHPDLVANLWVNPGEIAGNGIDDDRNGYVDDVHGYDFADDDSDPSDSGDHGTHVAGTIAAVGDNQIGVIGVTGQARVLALKASGNGDTLTSAATIEAVQYATALKTRGVNIVALNASYGGGGSSTAERAAIQAAADAGILFCAAAGNEGANNDTTATYPAGYRLANMIVVAATTQTDALASYSNHGATTVDLAAPGSNILSTQPATVSFQVNGATYASTALEYSGLTTGVDGAIIDCGIGNAGDFPASVKGQIALIQRGTINFSTKVENAMAAGALAAIIHNNISGNFNGTLQSAGAWIPVRSVSQADGAAIKAALPRSGAIVVSGNYQFLSGTSMATPLVAGAVVIAAAHHPGDTLAARRARVLAAVDARSGLAGKVLTGGRLNVQRIADANLNGYADRDETTPAIDTAALPLAVNGDAYSVALSASGGIPPYRWALAGGALPVGLALSAEGVIAGTGEGEPATHRFTVRVTDQLGANSTRALELQTAATGPLHQFTWSPLPATAYAGAPIAVRLTARDARGRIVTTLSGAVALASAADVAPSSVTLSGGVFTGHVSFGRAVAAAVATATRDGASGASEAVEIFSAASSSADGLPDAWKRVYGLDPTADLRGRDSDGDGSDEAAEYAAGTDPIDAGSVFRVTLLEMRADALVIEYPVVAGKLYRVRSSEDLATWTTLEDGILATEDGTRSARVERDGRARVFLSAELVNAP